MPTLQTTHAYLGHRAVGYLQGLPFLLAILGDRLYSLEVYGRTGLLDDFKLCTLWTVPNLRQLSLNDLLDYLAPQDFERGMTCLR